MNTCVMLAAGQGKRMQPLTYTRPKVMLPIANKPIIEWNLLKAKSIGITQFLFIIGYKSEMVRNYFQDGSAWGVQINYVNQGMPKGTGHAISLVESFIDDEFVVISGDTIFGTDDIRKINDTPISMGVCEVSKPEDYGVVDIQDDHVNHIYEKIKDPISHMINAGIYHFTNDIFGYIKKTGLSKRGEYELTDAVNTLTSEKPMRSVVIKKWQDIGYPWDMFDATRGALEEITHEINGNVEPYATIQGPVVIGEGTTIMNGSYIIGPVIIGRNCKIGPNCYIRPYTAIGDGCHVGGASEIKNSVIMDESNIPHHNYVGDSVIGSGCNLGSGTKVANLRLDKKTIYVEHHGMQVNTNRQKLGVIMGDNVQTGINAVINVGSIIGDSVLIGPGSMVSGTIDPGTKIL